MLTLMASVTADCEAPAQGSSLLQHSQAPHHNGTAPEDSTDDSHSALLGIFWLFGGEQPVLQLSKRNMTEKFHLQAQVTIER